MLNYSVLFNNFGSFVEVIAGVLGIAITVVAIIVELAATRYTPKITDMFIRNRTNTVVLGFYIFTSLFGIWIALIDVGLDSAWYRAGIWTYLGCVSLSFTSILPYFFYVFTFLHPENVINRLEQEARARLQASVQRDSALSEQKDRFFQSVEQISDIGINSIANLDRSLGLTCIDSLRQILLAYFPQKQQFPDFWFQIDRENFLGFSRESIRKIEADRTWVEMSVLKQYEFIFAKSVRQIRELVQEIASATRDIALAAARQRLPESIELLVIYFNTFLRISLNERNQYAIYNIFDQYRCFAEEVMAIDAERTLEIAGYFKYYGQFSLTIPMPFSLVIASHDLRMLNERAYQTGFAKQKELLQVFLELDKPPETKLEEIGLRGVRKSQAILASFYLEHGERDLARRIFEDMASEPHERLQSIEQEILSVEKERFWEVTDRWINFDYVSPSRRKYLKEFFSWFRDKK